MPIGRERIIVIGGGIAGATAALEIGKTGQDVVLFEQSRYGLGGAERSEVTHPDDVMRIGADEAVSNLIYSDSYFVPERNLLLHHSLPETGMPPLVAIEHRVFLKAIRDQISQYPNITIEEKARVTDLSETKHGATAIVNGQRVDGRFAVNATGAFGGNLPFEDKLRQRQFDHGIVGVAYGRRFHGTINVPNGERAILSSLSLDGSGRSSWVLASSERGDEGGGVIDVVWSDYARRDEAARVITQAGKTAYEKLLANLEKPGLITVEGKAGPHIGGIFGLEPRHTRSGGKKIIDIGERGQTSSASIGDSIGPILRLSEKLAEITARNGTAEEYEEAAEAVFGRKHETAILRTRLKASILGRGTQAILSVLKTMSPERQIEYLRSHKLSIKDQVVGALRYPPAVLVAFDVYRERLREELRGMEDTLDPQYSRAGITVSFE